MPQYYKLRMPQNHEASDSEEWSVVSHPSTSSVGQHTLIMLWKSMKCNQRGALPYHSSLLTIYSHQSMPPFSFSGTLAQSEPAATRKGKLIRSGTGRRKPLFSFSGTIAQSESAATRKGKLVTSATGRRKPLFSFSGTIAQSEPAATRNGKLTRSGTGRRKPLPMMQEHFDSFRESILLHRRHKVVL